MQTRRDLKPLFKVDSRKGYVFLELNLKIILSKDSLETVQAFDKRIDECLVENKISPWIFSCGNMDTIPPPWLRPLVRLARDLREKNLPFRLFGATDPFIEFLKIQGLSDTFLVAESLKAALIQCKVPIPVAFDVKLLNPILAATIKVIKVQAGIEVSSGGIFIKKSSDPLAGEISGIIALFSPNSKALVILTFPKLSLLNIVSKILGEECIQLTPEVENSAADMLNLIFDQAKMNMNQEGLEIKTAVSGILSGTTTPSLDTNRSLRFAIPFSHALGNFAIEVFISE